MKRTDLSKLPCSIARTSNLLGDWWTPLVLREAFFGTKRFDEFIKRLGIGRNVLTQRFSRLIDEDIFVRIQYQDKPPRYEYHLTEKGRALFDVLAAMIRWGDDWLAEAAGAPIELIDTASGKIIKPMVVDAKTLKPIVQRNIEVRKGPGFPSNLKPR
ncbi:MAG: helix-turn-helix transcriptional regulator [Xanthomonadales bacterium]|nr:helix-turn-helix transcriptional regulator [Xanthomonadales bacterium]